MAVPGDRGRFLEGLGDSRDGRSSYSAVPVRVGDESGVGIDWVRDASANEAILYSVAPESQGVAFGGEASSVNHMGWYRLRAIVARRIWRVCRRVWGCRTIFQTM